MTPALKWHLCRTIEYRCFVQNFSITVILPGLARESQTIKIRLLPGPPKAIKIDSVFTNGLETAYEPGIFSISFCLFFIPKRFNFFVLCADPESPDQFRFEVENQSLIALGVAVVDSAGNVTLAPNITVQAKVWCGYGM